MYLKNTLNTIFLPINANLCLKNGGNGCGAAARFLAKSNKYWFKTFVHKDTSQFSNNFALKSVEQ